MKKSVRLICVLIVSAMALGLFGCSGGSAADDAAVLQQRRDAAESYMRQMANYLWRASEDIVYTRDPNVLTDEDLASYMGNNQIVIKAGRLYRGIPYSYAGNSALNFMDYAGEPDEKGIHTVSGLHWRALNGGSATGARVGNDCSSAVQLAWNSIGGSMVLATTDNMVRDRGYLPVGSYTSDPSKNVMTQKVCETNGINTMCEAYAQLQKADAVVNREDGFGHTMMVVSVNVVRKDDGSIDPMRSKATFLHQTSTYIKEQRYVYDETLGEPVYTTFGIDTEKSFLQLFGDGYLPVTCKELIDPAPVQEPYVKDSLTEHSFDNILKGQFRSNRIISRVTITVTDEKGEVVMQASCYNRRQSGQNLFTFDLRERFWEELEQARWGDLDLENLAPGAYHCTHVLRSAHGEEYTVRSFDFTV